MSLIIQKWFDRDLNVPAAGGNVTATPGTLALVLTKFAPTVLTPRLMTPGKLSLTLTTFAPTVLTPRLATPGKLSLVLTKFAPTVLTPRLVTPGKLSLTLTTFAPTVLTPRLATPGKLSLILTTFAPTVTVGVGGGAQTVTPGTAALIITLYAPVVSVTGQASQIQYGNLMLPVDWRADQDFEAMARVHAMEDDIGDFDRFISEVEAAVSGDDEEFTDLYDMPGLGEDTRLTGRKKKRRGY